MPLDKTTRLDWDIRVNIRREYKKEMPFEGITGRRAMALVWTYVDWRNEVTDILQQLSHRSRAYFFNAHGLQGFLIKATPMLLLNQARTLGELEQVTRWQHIDFEKLMQKLSEHISGTE